LARSEGDLAGALDKFLEAGAGDAPGFLETEHPGAVVRAEIPAEVPALGFAYCAHGRLEACVGTVGGCQIEDHRVLQLEQRLAALALGFRLCLVERALHRGWKPH